MAKLLAAGGVVVAALLVLLWMQLQSPSEASPSEAAAPPAPAAPAPAPAQPTELASAVAKVQVAVENSKKIDPASDEFFHRFDDPQPQILTRSAAKCYTGGLERVHRNQKVKLAFRNHIKNGDVYVTDVRVVESTINNPKLVECFRREVANTRWHDPELPDWEADDELVIRPERGMKKHMKDNIEYVGDVAPPMPTGPIGPPPPSAD